MHELLTKNLDLIIENQNNDWDFKELISGDGMTRTGKSTIGFQCGQYQDENFAKNWKDQVIFDGNKLTETAYRVGKGKVLVYDEAREGLDSKKQMERYTKNLLDFFSQCGNLNHIIIIVLPEFFDLPKSIAITQSIFLINCYAKNGFDRGYFDFFNRKDKKFLYVKGQKFLDYKAQSPSFKGTFTKFIPFPREEYESLKNKTLHKLKKEKTEAFKEQYLMEKLRIKILLNYLIKELKKKPIFISQMIGVSRTMLYKYLKFSNEKDN
jgi:hypothetical protein